MKKHLFLIFLLAGSLLLNACGTQISVSEGTAAAESTANALTAAPPTAAPATGTTAETTPPTTTVTEVPPEPIREEKYLPEPYVDIVFSADGTVRDLYGHVSCTLPNPSCGRVVNEPVSFGGQSYTVPHLYTQRENGAILLTYEYLLTESDVTRLMARGFTIEAFLVNHNRLSAGDREQCMTNAGQSGGFGLSVKNGKLGFGVYTDSSYKTASMPRTYDTENLTHLLGVYDPTAQKVLLYVNGTLASNTAASGVFRPAQSSCHPYIVLGGDIGSGAKTELHATNTRIADFKLYPAALTGEQATIAFETARAALTGAESDFQTVYQPVEGLPKGTEGALHKTVLNSFADVHEPLTSLTVSPTVWQWANDSVGTLAAGNERPATVLFDLRMVGNALHAYDTAERDLGAAEDAVAALNGRIIPAFRVTDPAVDTPLTELINTQNLGDCFVICADGARMRRICEATVCARPVLDRSTAEQVDPNALLTETAYFGTKRVLLPASVLTQENVLAMHARSMSVFAMLEANPDVTAVHDAVFMGVDGILTADSGAVLDYYRKFTETTVSKSSLIVAHRGDHAAYPDNTLRSLISGAESGANIIELDIWMTADGHLVLNHDAKTNGWSEVLDCKTATRAQLESLKCTTAHAAEGDKLAFFDEVLDYFSKNHTDMILFAEVKDTRHETIDLAVKLTREYGMQGRVLFLSMNESFDQYTFSTHRVPLQKNSSTVYPRTDMRRALALSCIDLAGLPTDYFSQWKDASADLMRILRHRGIAYGPWTTNTAADTDTHFFLGYANFTTNVPHQCDQYLRFLKVDEVDDRISVTAVYYDGTTADVTGLAEFVPLSGEITYRDGKVSGQGSYAFRLKTALPLRTDLTYFVYSLSVRR